MATKKPKTPGSKGGPNVGSVNTFTDRFFHPKGGFDNKAPSTAKRPAGAPGYKDSGQRATAQKVGVSK